MSLPVKHIRASEEATGKKALVFIVCFLLFATHLVCAQSVSYTSREYKVKAVFLFNFSQFVEWPPTTFVTNDSPFIIGVLGSDPFGSFLDETVAGEKMIDHPIIVQRYSNAKDIEACHILFISLPKPNKDTIASLNKRGILTVSDSNDFIHLGGAVRFITENGKVRFQINPSAAKSGGLNISSKLLRVAKVVDYKIPEK